MGKKSTQRFCSVACQNEWQSQQTGDKNKRYHRLMVACDNCGKNVSIIPANQNRFKKHFCSNSCRREWYASVWSQSKEWREESAKRAVKILSNMEKARTRPQIIVNEMLDDARIQYINEYGIGRYAIDNFLPNQNLMIEVMGDFWHCNPTVYDSPIYRIQKERIIKDTEKHSYILDVCHLQTLYLWEKDVIDRPQLCRRLIAEYVDSNGNLPYYHSYNWEIQNGVLLPNANPIPEYQNRNTEEKIAS